MTDIELLKRAAKAAGISKQWDGSLVDRNHPERVWNPRDDDGDAFRLAVKLSFHVKVCRRIVAVEKREMGDDVIERLGDDPLTATRRAIVRAAAALADPD